MSDNSDSCSEDFKYDKANGKADDICRDFLRNVCKRGKRCKYQHPNADEAQDLGRKHEYTFCHDYQNTGCRRSNCKFLHCTREEEEYYRQTGQLPVRLQQAAALGIGVAPNELPLLKGEVPICKDFLKGECKRATKCKYRHVSSTEYSFDVRKPDVRNNHSYDSFEDDFDGRFDRYDYGHTSLKRRRIEMDGFNSYESRYPSMRPLSYQLLEDENTLLRRKVEELKKQVADLTATNEVLLEQNARYRVSKATVNAAVPVSQPLTVSQTLSQAVAPVAAVAATPAPAPHSISHLTQQIALNSDMATQHALQTAQRMARELAAPAQASMAPQSLNPSVTMNPASMVPVSLPQTNIATVSLAPVSMQQTLRPVCSITQSIPQNLAAPSTPLVSYPIVSQSLRTAVAPSSLAH